MKIHREWVKLPSAWLLEGESETLRNMKWKGVEGSTNLAALMVLLPIAHEIGIAQKLGGAEVNSAVVTYRDIMAATGLSRASISKGLDRLEKLGVIQRAKQGRNIVCMLIGVEAEKGWAMLPARALYNNIGTKIEALYRFKMRSKTELHALKIYYLIAALRNNQTNQAEISYDKIWLRAGVPPNEIPAALSHLNLLGLTLVTARPREGHGVIHGYRLVGLHPRLHAGTVGRSDIGFRPAASFEARK